MDVLPAIDLLDGRAVRLLHGRRDAVTDMGDPVEVAWRFVDAGAPMLHVVDLSGAFAGHPVHTGVVGRIAERVPVQLGGGLRTRDDVVRTLDLGVSRVILGTAAVETPALLDAVEADRLVVGVDIKDGRVAVRGWVETADVAPEAFVDGLARRGVRRILCTAVSRDGTLAGPDVAALERVTGRGCAVIASGGVGTLDDLRHLAKVDGIESVVVGKALLMGRFSYAEAVEAAC